MESPSGAASSSQSLAEAIVVEEPQMAQGGAVQRNPPVKLRSYQLVADAGAQSLEMPQICAADH